jgi:arginase family enzyme
LAQPPDLDGPYDLAVLGVPLSVTSAIQPCAIHRAPQAVRERLAGLSTYHSERDVDIESLRAADFGDLDDQPSDPDIARVLDRMRGASLIAMLGGDNALTVPAMLALAGEGIEAWGLVSVGNRHDVAPYHGRAGSESVVRALVDAGLSGEQVVQVGIAGFGASIDERRWCDEQGIEVISAAEVRFNSVEDVLVEALDRLAMSVDHIYVSLDLAVLDRACAPGCAAAHPGGLATRELLAAAFLSARHDKVRAIDVVEVDPEADVAYTTVDTAALCLLNAAAGLRYRLS